MSGYPPPGPPPYYGLYPPPPQHLPPGAYTYLPPSYPYHSPPQWPQQPYVSVSYAQYLQPPTPTPTQPTPTPPPNFGINIVEQPVVATPEPEPTRPPPPVEVTPDVISWVPATPTTAKDLDYKAVVGGKEGYDGSPLWIIRAHHKCELIPGKLAIRHRYAFIPSAGQEIPVHHFEVLCTKPDSVQWIACKNGKVPDKAVEAGYTLNAENLYIGRVSHKSSITPGKIQPSHACCYISYGGTELSFRKYEVLCKV